MKRWQGFLVAFGCFSTVMLLYTLFTYVRKRPNVQILYEPCPNPHPSHKPRMSPLPRHPEKVLDWYKKHVYWDPTVPSPERIELLHQWQLNKKKTRRANALTV